MKIKTLTRQQAQKLDRNNIISGTAVTPIGVVTISMLDNCIISVDFGGSEKHYQPWAQDTMDSFFNNQDIKTPLLLIGTEFQTTVWKALASVPWGTVITYGKLSQLSDHPKAFRAIGTAMNKNPIPILVPCHRVLASGNKIGGYGGGIALKKKLLEKEGVLKSVQT